MNTQPLNIEIDEGVDAKTPVRPHFRIVPNGAKGGVLSATVLVTPDGCTDDVDGNALDLRRWPEDIMKFIRDVDRTRGEYGRPDTLEIEVLPITGCPGGAAPNPANLMSMADQDPENWPRGYMEARFSSLESINQSQMKKLGTVWQSTLKPTLDPQTEIPNTDRWGDLAEAISLSLEGAATTAGKMEEPGVDKVREGNFGDEGQLRPTSAQKRNEIDAIIQVPHADLALSLEFQRVEELLQSLEASCGKPEARKEAELALSSVLSPRGDIDPDLDIFAEARGIEDEDERKAEEKKVLKDARKTLKIKERNLLVDSLEKGNRELGTKAFAEEMKRSVSPTCILLSDNANWTTSLGPSKAANTKNREKAFGQCCDAHAYATWPQYQGDKSNGVNIDPKEVLKDKEKPRNIAQSFFAIQTNPSLSRAFGLAFDVQIELGEESEALLASARYFFLSLGADTALDDACDGPSQRAKAWTLVKIDKRDGDWHFWPATEEEMHAHVLGKDLPVALSQFDGVLVMGSEGAVEQSGDEENTKKEVVPRFDLTSLDVRSATEMELQRRKIRQSNVDGRAGQEKCIEDTAWEDLSFGATLQTSGLTLLCRSIQSDAARRLARRVVKSETLAEGQDAPAGQAIYTYKQVISNDLVQGLAEGIPDKTEFETKHLVLDADDLTIGYRLMVGMPKLDWGTEWRPLMNRFVTFGAGSSKNVGEFVETILEKLLAKSGRPERSAIESAFLAVPSRLLPTGGSGSEAVVEQGLAVWSGEPMGVDCANVGDEPPRAPDSLGIGRTLSLPQKEGGVLNELPPPLRYGWPYRFAMAAVYAGGHSVPVEELPAETGRQDSEEARIAERLYYPSLAQTRCLGAQTKILPFYRALRQRKLSAPTVLLPKGHALRTSIRTATRPKDVYDFARRGRKCGPMGFEQGGQMIVRSLVSLTEAQQGDARINCRETPDLAQRIILVPGLPLEEVGLHGVFDKVGNGISRPVGALPELDFSVGSENFPVISTTRSAGMNRQRFTTRRNIVHAPSARTGSPEKVLGDPVFAKSNQRGSSYYPDPAADYVAIGLRRPGEQSYLPGGPVLIPIRLEDQDFPKLLPILITLEKSDGNDRPDIQDISNVITSSLEGVAKSFDPSLTDDITRGSEFEGQEIRLKLAPGESFEIDLWCVPSAERLAREFSVIQSLGIVLAKRATAGPTCEPEAILKGMDNLPARLRKEIAQAVKAVSIQNDLSYIGPGGVVVPSNRILRAIAAVIHDHHACHPLYELGAVATVDAIHACNRAYDDPEVTGQVVPDPFPSAQLDPESLPKVIGKAAALSPLAAFRPYAPKASGRTSKAESCPDEGQANNKKLVEEKPQNGPIKVAAIGSSHLVMSGEISVDLETNDTIEVVAKTILPGHSVFDDTTRGRSLAQRRAGTWPLERNLDGTPVMHSGQEIPLKAAQVFGFTVSPQGKAGFQPVDVTLLRVEGLPRGTGTNLLSLRSFFEEIGIGQARVTHRHIFPDGKARRMMVRVNALSRTAELMRTSDRVAASGDPWLDGEGLVYKKGEMVSGDGLHRSILENLSNEVEVILPATVRPAKCDARAPFPAFAWTGDQLDEPGVRAIWKKRTAVIRIPLGREWFSSGQDEKVGIVMWPPVTDFADRRKKNVYPIPDRDPSTPHRFGDLSKFSDEDLGEGGAFVTRRGGDPVKGGQGEETKIFLGPADFPDLLRKSGHRSRAECIDMVQLPLGNETAENDQAPPTMMVSLLTYEPLFDPETEQWYVDVDIGKSEAPDAFVRLGLVRYQPHTVPELRCSRPVVQWSQILPERKVIARRVTSDGNRIEISIRGQASNRRKLGSGLTEKAKSRLVDPQIKLTLFAEEERQPADSANGKASIHRRSLFWPEDVGNDLDPSVLTLRPIHEGGHSHWKTSFPSDLAKLAIGRAKVLVEEIEFFRPATYDEEPVSEASEAWQETLRASGPRFSTILDLASLLEEIQDEN